MGGMDVVEEYQYPIINSLDTVTKMSPASQFIWRVMKNPVFQS
jgi:hypothetical protein